MTTSLLSDAFAHHVWATERLIDACTALTPEQLKTPAPGMYGSIIDTFRHLVEGDSFYRSVVGGEPTAPIDEEPSLVKVRSVITSNGTAWRELLAGEIDPDADVVELDKWHGVPPTDGHSPRAGHPPRHRSPQPDLPPGPASA